MDREQIQEMFSEPPVIYSERLIFRKITPADALDMYEYSRDPEVTKYLTWEPHASLHYTKKYIKDLQRAYKNGIYYDWALVIRSSGKMIGTCGFTSFTYENDSCEIGYVLNPAYHGRSFATEAAGRVIDYAFGVLGAALVSARCAPENTASRRVMEKCGMIHEYDIEHGAIKQRRFIRVSRYAISKERYFLLKQIGKTGI